MITSLVENPVQTEQKSYDAQAVSSLASRRDPAQIVGWILQVGLGLLVGFFAIQRLEDLHCLNHYIFLPIDGVSFLLVVMAILAAASPIAFAPRLVVPCRGITKVIALVGMLWYGIFSLTSYALFHRGVIYESADKPQVFAAFALLALPIALLIVALTRRSYQTTLPSWTLVLLALGLWGLPFNMQFGQLPICILGFVIAFQAGFLARGTKVLLLVLTLASFELFALSMGDYLMFLPGLQLPGLRFGGNVLLGPSHMGHYLILIIAASVGLLFYVPQKSRYPLLLIIGFFIGCLFLSQTRAALFGVLAGGIFLFFQRPKGYKLSHSALVCFILVAGAMFFIIVRLTEERKINEERGAMLVWALKEFTHNPLLGNGVGSWHSSYAEHLLANGVIPDDHSHCHNLIGEILCCNGLLGLLTFGIVVYCGFKIYSRARDSLASEDDRYALAACTAGIFGYLMSQAVNVLFWYQAIMLMVPVLTGAWMGYAASFGPIPQTRSTSSGNPKRWLWPLVLVVGLMTISAISTRHMPTFYKDYSEKLSNKWFSMAEPGEMPYSDVLGQITDRSNHPIKNVTVVIKPSGVKSFSDNNGMFRFKHIRKMPIGENYKLELRHNGYVSKTFEISQLSQGPTKLALALDQEESSHQ